MSQVLFIAGYKRSGKDTFGELLAEEIRELGATVKLVSFAGPMKEILSVTLGMSVDKLEALKNIPGNIHRDYLQRFGSEAMKPIFGDDVWVKVANNQIAGSSEDFVIVTDFRFPEEYTGCIAQPTTIRVHRESVTPTAAELKLMHVSEKALNGFTFNVDITNNGSLEELREKAVKFINARINL